MMFFVKNIGLIYALICLFACSNDGKVQVSNKVEPQKVSDADCAKFHTGRFSIPDQVFGAYAIERTADKQIETVQNPKLVVEFDIVWKDACTYQLSFNKILHNGVGESVIPVLEGLVRTCTIDSLTPNGYVHRFFSNKNEEMQQDEVLVVH